LYFQNTFKQSEKKNPATLFLPFIWLYHTPAEATECWRSIQTLRNATYT